MFNSPLKDKKYVRMIERFIADDNRYHEGIEEKANEAAKLGADEQVIHEWENAVNLVKRYISYWSEFLYEDHWYVPIPFTNKRLIFAGFRYVGWYIYK